MDEDLNTHRIGDCIHRVSLQNEEIFDVAIMDFRPSRLESREQSEIWVMLVILEISVTSAAIAGLRTIRDRSMIGIAVHGDVEARLDLRPNMVANA